MQLVSRSVNDDKGVINASDKALPWHMASRFGFMHVLRCRGHGGGTSVNVDSE